MMPPNVMTETMPVSTCVVVMEGPAAGAGENICRVIAFTALVVKIPEVSTSRCFRCLM